METVQLVSSFSDVACNGISMGLGSIRLRDFYMGIGFSSIILEVSVRLLAYKVPVVKFDNKNI